MLSGRLDHLDDAKSLEPDLAASLAAAPSDRVLLWTYAGSGIAGSSSALGSHF
jgi:hypothetical protein